MNNQEPTVTVKDKREYQVEHGELVRTANGGYRDPYTGTLYDEKGYQIPGTGDGKLTSRRA
jgi:hypothetical protein